MEYLGCLPFTQATRMEILCINICLLNLTRRENDPPQSVSKSAEQTKKSAKIDSPQIKAHISEASKTERREPFDFLTGVSGFLM